MLRLSCSLLAVLVGVVCETLGADVAIDAIGGSVPVPPHSYALAVQQALQGIGTEELGKILHLDAGFANASISSTGTLHSNPGIRRAIFVLSPCPAACLH